MFELFRNPGAKNGTAEPVHIGRPPADKLAISRQCV